MRRLFPVEYMIVPCGQVEIKAARDEVHGGPFVAGGAEQILERVLAGEIGGPGEINIALSLVRSEIHDHEQTLVRPLPGERKELGEADIASPGRSAFQELPASLTDSGPFQ